MDLCSNDIFLLQHYAENQVAKAPDGNGGVYAGNPLNHDAVNQKCMLLVLVMTLCLFFFLWLHPALKSKRLLDDMNAKGVKYVDCYGVDNVLVSMFSVQFISWSLPFLCH